MNIFRKKFIPINTYDKKTNNRNHHKKNSINKRTNSQILFEHRNNNEIIDNMDIDNTIQTRSIKYSASEDPLYLEQKNYDIESSKYMKNISKSKDNTSSMNENTNNKVYNFLDNSVHKLNLNKKLINSKKNNSYNYLNKSSSNQSGNKDSNSLNSKNIEQSSNSNISNNISNYNELNLLNHESQNKKGLIYNYNQMNNYIKNNNKLKNKKSNKDHKSKSYSKYFDLIKNCKNKESKNLEINNLKNNDTSSTNEFTKLKSKYLELKNLHDLTLSKLKKEKKKNKIQKEEIELMINSIKSEEMKGNTLEEMNEVINKLKEENATFRQELVLSQALINSLQSEIKSNYKNRNIINNGNANTLEDNSETDKNANFKPNKFNRKNYNDISDLIKEINELNHALNKKNLIIDSVLIENKKLRNQLKSNNSDIYSNDNKLSDIIYKDAIELINKYSQYRNSNMDDFNNLILTEKFFDELEKLKKDIEGIKYKKNIEQMVEYYISLIKLISNEFDKLLLYNNNYWKEKYLNKYKSIDENNINKSLEFNFNKEKHHLMDLCLLSSSYIKGLPKDLLLEGINLIKNLENLYKEKNRIKNSNKTEKDNINDLIMRQEKQLDNIKRKLSNNLYNQSNSNSNHYLRNFNSASNIKNILGLTYMTNYYNNNIN